MTIKFFDSAAILTFITVFLYCSSTAFIHGYFGVLYLDSGVLDRNFHQILYHGMILNIWTLLTLPFLIALFFTMYGMCATELSRYIRNSHTSGKKIVKLKRALRIEKKQPNLFELKHLKRMKISWLIFLSVFSFMLSMAYFEVQGKEAAHAILVKVANKKHNVVKVKSKEKNEPLAFLYCGARNCAALNIVTKEIVYFPQTGHSNFLYKKTYQNGIN